MTAWRVGLAIKPEAEFGVENQSATWKYIGVGMDFNFTENNSWKFQNGLGSKTPQLEFESRFSGTWGLNLYLDYNNFYWLLFGLEDYAFKKLASVSTEAVEGGRDIGLHIFSTSNKKSLKPFSLRIMKLDRPVGGYTKTLPMDEDIVLLGCTMSKVSPSYEGSSTSAIKVSVGGSFVDTILTAKQLSDTTDSDIIASKNTVVPVNWGCLQTLKADNSAWEKVANNERTGFTFQRTVTTVPDCGQRIDTGFFEQSILPISITSLVYSRNPNQWQTRMHSGGIRNDLTAINQESRPVKKGLQACPNIRIASGTANPSERTPDYECFAEFEDIVVDSWGNTYNSGSEITENPTLKAMTGRIIIRTPDVTNEIATYSQVYTVTYNFNNGADVPNLVMYYPADTEIKLIDYKGVKANNTFTGWSDGTSPYKAGQSVRLSADKTFTAVWTPTA